MSLVRFQAKNHRQQVTARAGADDSIDDRATTPADFAKFDLLLGPFTLDVAAAAHNTKCARYFTIVDDGLRQSWAGERVWCNPPYSRIGAWVEKAWREHETTDGIAMLLPANRTEQGWWQHMCQEQTMTDDPVGTIRCHPDGDRYAIRTYAVFSDAPEGFTTWTHVSLAGAAATPRKPVGDYYDAWPVIYRPSSAMNDDARDAAARALLQLIGYGPDKQFPHPDVKYREALAVVDALTGVEHV